MQSLGLASILFGLMLSPPLETKGDSTHLAGTSQVQMHVQMTMCSQTPARGPWGESPGHHPQEVLQSAREHGWCQQLVRARASWPLAFLNKPTLNKHQQTALASI